MRALLPGALPRRAPPPDARAWDRATETQPGEIAGAMRACRPAFVGVGIASGLVNLLALSGSIYMLQVYDRVIPSHSVATLVGLTLLLLVLYAAFGFFDVMRSRLLSAIGRRLDRLLRERVFALFLSTPLQGSGPAGSQPLRDLEQIRRFVGGLGPTALFDLPWLPLFLGFVFLLHPTLGLLATLGAAGILALTVVAERSVRAPVAASTLLGRNRAAFAEAGRRNAEAIKALGMRAAVTDRWLAMGRGLAEQEGRAAAASATLGSAIKVLRMALQSAILGLGALLVIKGEASAGVIIAASIASSRALAPVEVAVAHWKSFVSARESYRRLDLLLRAAPPRRTALSLPAPAGRLDVEALTVGPPGGERAILHDIDLHVTAGAAIGVVGPSGSGKSTLARALVGVWAPHSGHIRLDGSALEHWEPDAIGRHIGYLPQDVELFGGTVAENIARFQPGATDAQIVHAARTAGVHEMIARLPRGYDTPIGEGGSALSAGQRQRVALARALFGEPFLLVLDEPNSNLDSEGEDALTRAIVSVRERGGIVVVIAHRPSALAAVDRLLVLASGRQVAFGPREEVLRQTMRPAGVVPMSQPVRPDPAAALVSQGGRR